ncbi:helix-turn-helix domain-containing protein [Mucilaginibacter sp.]|jgi:AraC-like DNA-binding protein|uniref:helix-turn-helix domain-containing protein n=1 Tax=Mucilaginibacter sp. TaxID=1882438 RepID=UPI003562A635
MNKQISHLDIPTTVKRHFAVKPHKGDVDRPDQALLFRDDFAILKNTPELTDFQPVKTDYYSIALCLNGSCQRTISHFMFEVYPLSIHLLSPGHLHTYADPSHDLHLYQVLFKKEFITEGFIKENILENLLEVNSDFAPIYGISQQGFRSIKAIYEKIEEEMAHSGSFHLQIVKLLLIELLYEMNRACEKCLMASNRHLNRQYQLVIKFKKLIDENYLTLKTVQEYADLLYVSAKYLTQVVKSQTGENALNLIHKRQYREASYLLSTSLLSIKEIAERLNFDNSSHFSRFFKNHSGVNPTAFKAF